MGEEIQRARGLLAAVIREGLLSPEEANRAYESWAASSGDVPFSRFLIRQGLAADRIRQQLRRAAVLGLPNPDLHTYERFEDLLVGQLGIEAGMLSPKLLRSVRAVQDKKVGEGKLRRLSDLLPRAGFDENLLALLHQHLHERILLCRGCLGRYPRRDLTSLSIPCPRCGDEISAESLEPSELLELQLASDQKSALAASSAHMLATKDRDSSVTDREEKRPAPERKGDGALLAIVGVLSLVVVGGLVALVLLESAPAERVVPTLPSTSTTDPVPTIAPVPDASGARTTKPLTADQARQQDTQLVREGRYAELLAIWEQVEPSAGDNAAEHKRRRMAELRTMVALGEQAKKLLDKKVIADGLLPSETERSMAQVLLKAPPFTPPPFDRLAAQLRQVDNARWARVKQEAQERYAKAQGRADPRSREWERRAAAVQGARPLYGVWLGGRLVDGVRVMAVDGKGFTVSGPEGEAQLGWTEEPVLGLSVFQAVADLEQRSDQLELLRLALLSRDPLVTTRSKGRLGLELDTDSVLREAPSSIPVRTLGGDRARLRYPLAWLGSDLRLGPGTSVRPSPQALVLEGPGCSLSSVALPMLTREKREPLALAVTASLSGGTQPHLDLLLVTKNARRRYVASWGSGSWELRVDFGSGSTPLQQGQLGPAQGTARLEFTGKEVVFSLGGRELGRTSVWTRFPEARFTVGAAKGPLRIEALAVEGHLDGPRLVRAERNYVSLVGQTLDRIGAVGGPVTLPKLSVESPQELAPFSAQDLGKLEAAKKAYLAGRLGEASDMLRHLEKVSQQNLVAATYYRACVALRRFDLGQALLLLDRALRKQGRFPEAKTLRGLTLVLAGRTTVAGAVLDEVFRERPDQAALHLARAWASYAARDRGLPPTLSDEAQVSLAVASNLQPGDPLVRIVERALRGAVARERGFSARHVGQDHVVLVHTGAAEAKAICDRLDKHARRFPQVLGRARFETPRLVVTVHPHDEFRVLAGAKARVGWFDARSGQLLLDGAVEPSEPEGQRALYRAVAEGYVARRYGALPPWLGVGLSERLAAHLLQDEPAEDLLKILADNDPWKPSDWAELFGLDRDTLRANTLARARAFALLQIHKPVGFRDQLETLAKGESARLPGDLDLEKVEQDLRSYLKQRE